MKREHKSIVRLAIAIHQQISRSRELPALGLPTDSWERCTTLLRQVRRARQHGWQLTAARCQRDLRDNIEQLQIELIAISQQLESQDKNERRTATIEEIFHDLLALHDEFDEVSWNRRGHTLSVTTEPIELEGIDLGPFEIQLDWRDLFDGHPNNYRVIATDAHPAAANESVTHPHVQDESVCEGEGRVPIRHALEQGRLLDFFLIVRNLLRTYNDSSPYVALRDWYGVECADCGGRVSDDERSTCERCEATLCGECYYSCIGCDHVCCAECITRCEICDEMFCDKCITRCSKCRVVSCTGCLDKDERCGDCHEQENDEASEDPEDMDGDNHGHAGAPVQPDRVGQIAVPA